MTPEQFQLLIAYIDFRIDSKERPTNYSHSKAAQAARVKERLREVLVDEPDGK